MDAKILIVEDERDIADLLRYNLQEAGLNRLRPERRRCTASGCRKNTGSYLTGFNASRSRWNDRLSLIKERPKD